MARSDRYSSNKHEQRRELTDIEDSIEALNVAYKRYSNGVDNRPPVKIHQQLKKSTRLLEVRGFRSAELRFKFNGLRARLITYEQYWTRVMLQIERGTYKRVVAVARIRQNKIMRGEGHTLERLAGSSGNSLGIGQAVEAAEVSGAESMAEILAAAEAAVETVSKNRSSDTKRPGASKRPRPRPSATKPPILPDGVNSQQARQLFKEFVAAKKAAGQSTTGITYGALVKKLARDVPKLRKQYGSERNIEFEVSTEKGRVRLRAKG
jgi:hypothetical protein